MRRRLSWRPRGFHVAAGGALALFVWQFAWAAPLDPARDDWEGLSQLVRLAQAELGTGRVIVTRALTLESLHAADGVVLVHPERALPTAELTAFMRAGGRVVLLDDYGTGDKLLEHFGIRRVPLPAHPVEMLRGIPSLAIAEPVSTHAAVHDVTRVVTNHATGLSDTGLLPLLVVSGNREPDVLLAVAGLVGKGRFVAVGDASVAMNFMLRYPGNRALATALVKVAADDSPPDSAPDAESVSGRGKLYFTANDCVFLGHFREGKASASPVAEVQRTLRDAADALRHGVSSTTAYGLALIFGIGVILWATSRAGRTHRRLLPRFVRSIPVVAQGGVAGHAAILGAPGTGRILAVLELKTALEEQLVARLGLERQGRTPPHSELLAEAVAASLVNAAEAEALSRLFASLSRYESMLLGKHPGTSGRIRERDVTALAARVEALVGAMDANAKRRGRTLFSP